MWITRDRPTSPRASVFTVDMVLAITQTPGHHASMAQRLGNQVTMTDGRWLARTWACMLLLIRGDWALYKEVFGLWGPGQRGNVVGDVRRQIHLGCIVISGMQD